MSLDKNLEELKLKYIEEFPFDSLLDFEVWSNQVSSLLNFDIELRTRFSSHTDNAYVAWRTCNKEDADAFIKNGAKILDQAITKARTIKTKENKFQEKQVNNVLIQQSSKLEVPKKITLAWLSEHVDIKHWLIVLSIFFTVFSVGVWVGQTEFYNELIEIISEKEK